MKRIKVKKGELLQNAGDINSYIYQIEKGILRLYAIDSKGREHILLFGIEGWDMGEANLIKTPCQFYIQALEDSIITIKNKDLNTNDTTKAFLIKCIAMFQERVIRLMSVSAIERYEHFIDTYPETTKRIPQKMIASYLGITPEALSKIKKQNNV